MKTTTRQKAEKETERQSRRQREAAVKVESSRRKLLKAHAKTTSAFYRSNNFKRHHDALLSATGLDTRQGKAASRQFATQLPGMGKRGEREREGQRENSKARRRES